MDRQYQIQDFAGDGNLDKLKQLLEPTHTQLEIDIALKNAIAYSRIEVAEYLIKLGADFSNYNYQGVYYAVHNNELRGLKFSVKHGVDVNLRKGLLLNKSIETATHTGDHQILRWLLSNGANPKLISRNSKRMAKRYGTLELQRIVKNAKENSNLKIIATYAIGIICLSLFFLMKNSTELSEFLDKAERTRTDRGFGLFAITGLIQYVLLIAGISIIATLTAILIRKKVVT